MGFVARTAAVTAEIATTGPSAADRAAGPRIRLDEDPVLDLRDSELIVLDRCNDELLARCCSGDELPIVL